MNIRKVLDETVSRFADKPGIISEGKEIPFKELREQTFKLANGLRLQGVSKGDKVAIYLPNSPEYVYSYLACFCLVLFW